MGVLFKLKLQDEFNKFGRYAPVPRTTDEMVTEWSATRVYYIVMLLVFAGALIFFALEVVVFQSTVGSPSYAVYNDYVNTHGYVAECECAARASRPLSAHAGFASLRARQYAHSDTLRYLSVFTEARCYGFLGYTLLIDGITQGLPLASYGRLVTAYGYAQAEVQERLALPLDVLVDESLLKVKLQSTLLEYVAARTGNVSIYYDMFDAFPSSALAQFACTVLALFNDASLPPAFLSSDSPGTMLNQGYSRGINSCSYVPPGLNITNDAWYTAVLTAAPVCQKYGVASFQPDQFLYGENVPGQGFVVSSPEIQLKIAKAITLAVIQASQGEQVETCLAVDSYSHWPAKCHTVNAFLDARVRADCPSVCANSLCTRCEPLDSVNTSLTFDELLDATAWYLFQTRSGRRRIGYDYVSQWTIDSVDYVSYFSRCAPAVCVFSAVSVRYAGKDGVWTAVLLAFGTATGVMGAVHLIISCGLRHRFHEEIASRVTKATAKPDFERQSSLLDLGSSESANEPCADSLPPENEDNEDTRESIALV